LILIDTKKYTKEQLIGRGIFALGFPLGIVIAFGFRNITLGPVIGFDPGLMITIGMIKI